MIDIDDFKSYNDEFGHQAGDEILQDIARILSEHSRKMDWVCRYGGEEFAVILPRTLKKEAIMIAERLREKIAKYSFLHIESIPDKKLTISLGISSFPDDAGDNSAIITRTDKQLYRAKQLGKNKICY